MSKSWWGERWIEALERMAPGYGLRLARGKTYARAGRTHDLTVNAGLVTAKVTGSRAQPYDVELQLPQLEAATWENAIDNMAAKARFSAELLAGQMPCAIDEAFAHAGAGLFPVQARDLVTKCSCPDSANPCKHVAATHYVLGEALDRDPFLLFELRGRTKEQVLVALRAARSGSRAAAHSEAGVTEPDEASPDAQPESDAYAPIAIEKPISGAPRRASARTTLSASAPQRAGPRTMMSANARGPRRASAGAKTGPKTRTGAKRRPARKPKR